MKVLAIVEIGDDGKIISPLPHHIYMKDATDEVVSKFIKNAEKLHEQKQRMTTIERNRIIRLDANFEEISKMGFVHVSELDKYLQHNITKIYHQLSVKFYLKYKIHDPMKKALIKLGGEIAAFCFKLFTKK